jgi:hypothetical protein
MHEGNLARQLLKRAYQLASDVDDPWWIALSRRSWSWRAASRATSAGPANSWRRLAPACRDDTQRRYQDAVAAYEEALGVVRDLVLRDEVPFLLVDLGNLHVLL